MRITSLFPWFNSFRFGPAIFSFQIGCPKSLVTWNLVFP
jgi:hypothetical protein